jgi:hypothetical protein
MSRALPALFLLIGACDSSGSNPMRQRNPDAMLQFGEFDLSVPPGSDLSVRPEQDFSAISMTDLKPGTHPDAGGSGGCTPVVNELLLSTLQAGTMKSLSSEEFVELYNPCTTAVSLKGWSIRYRSAQNNQGTNNADTILVTDINKSIAAGGYLLYAGSQYGGSSDGSLAGGLSDSGGGVALVDKTTTIVDSIAYGTAISSHNFLEGTTVPKAPPQSVQPGKTLARTPNGHDTDDNSADFMIATPTPKAAN